LKVAAASVKVNIKTDKSKKLGENAGQAPAAATIKPFKTALK
jgi:hypothetical protein